MTAPCVTPLAGALIVLDEGARDEGDAGEGADESSDGAHAGDAEGDGDEGEEGAQGDDSDGDALQASSLTALSMCWNA